MQEIVYHTNYKLEDNYFWFLARNKIILSIAEQYSNLKKNDRVLDIGCGTGGFAEQLNKQYSVTCLDTSPIALEYCKKRGLSDLFLGTLDEFNPKDKEIKAAFALDVIEHIEDDKAVVKQIFNVLPEKGNLIATVPAYKWLWSRHDEIHMHYRRYSKKHFEELLTGAGFKIKYASYYNSLLFLPAVAKRFLDKIIKSDKKEEAPVDEVSEGLNKVFYNIFVKEANLLKSIKFPFGLSIVVVAEK